MRRSVRLCARQGRRTAMRHVSARRCATGSSSCAWSGKTCRPCENRIYMRYRLLASVFAVCLVAMGQSLSVEKLVAFLHSSQQMIKDGKMTDRELAGYL